MKVLLCEYYANADEHDHPKKKGKRGNANTMAGKHRRQRIDQGAHAENVTEFTVY